MWIGFALAATWSTLHGLYAYFPEGVQFAHGVDLFHQELSIMRGTSKLYIIFRFHILGFFYFLKTEVALSLWVFNLLANILRGAFAILGVGNTPSLGSGHGIGHTLQVYHAMARWWSSSRWLVGRPPTSGRGLAQSVVRRSGH